jgi:indole-3-glycerol phosphate synthase
MSVLDEILNGVRADLIQRQALLDLPAVERLAMGAPKALDALAVLRRNPFAVIAEVKRASPSKGALARIDDPGALAMEYEAGGAGAISVLTERHRFGGSLEDLDAVRARVSTPVLRKDFVVDEYQVFEARAHGADLVLLIVAALSDAPLATLHSLIMSLGMTPLVEVHDAGELERALSIDPVMVGINARDLKTLDVDRRVFEELAPKIPNEIFTVAESGVQYESDVIEYASWGADAVLVGEALVTGGSPQDQVRRFLEVGVSNRTAPTL